MVKEYLPSFNQRWKKAKNGKEMQLILKEATMVVLDYSVLVYYMYEKSAELRNAVKNSKELKGNFDSVKKWLDAEGTKKYAASYVETVAAAAKNSR